MKYPKISIITVCLNSENVIEKTLQSVIFQCYKEIEYIIIDGKSSDKTLDIINTYRARISLLVSEEDSGIYNAMNKGLKLAGGDVVFFLNAGDCLADNDVVKDVAEIFGKKPELQLLYGNVVHDYGKKKKLRKYANVDRLFFVCSTICHQVIFAKKSLFADYGYFDERLIINADYDWLLNIFFREDIIKFYFDRTISIYDMAGFSSNQLDFLGEMFTSKKKYFNKAELLLYYPVCLLRQRFRKAFLEKEII